jgi:hypothetical protein
MSSVSTGAVFFVGDERQFTLPGLDGTARCFGTSVILESFQATIDWTSCLGGAVE